MASIYTREQIEQYLAYISFPQRFKPIRNQPRDLDLLTALVAHQITAIPFENLSLHYSSHRRISLDPQDLYRKLLTNGRGGYCMEGNIFFLHVLVGLGFKAYPTGARTRLRENGVPTGDFIGMAHGVNVVTLDDSTKWMVDVSFGGDGPSKPMPLREDVVTRNVGVQELRLVYDAVPQLFDQNQKVWIYQVRNGSDRPWGAHYWFREAEYQLSDFGIMSYWVDCSDDCFHRFALLAVKFTMTGEEVSGKTMLVNEVVKRNTGGRTWVVQVCKTEPERIAALEEHFGITLTDEEVKSIHSSPVALPNQ